MEGNTATVRHGVRNAEFWEYVDWSPDGKSIVVGMEPGMYPSAGITIVNLRTSETSELPGAKGMLFPRWSPKGGYLVAGSQDAKAVFLFDNHSRKWKQVAKLGQIYRFEWERDGNYLYYQDSRDPGQAVYRVEPKTGKVTKFIDFANLLRSSAGCLRRSGAGRICDGLSSFKLGGFAFLRC